MASVVAAGRAPCAAATRRRPIAAGDYADGVLALVGERPDWTLEEFVAALHKQRMPGSRSALWRFLERHDIGFEKKPARG